MKHIFTSCPAVKGYFLALALFLFSLSAFAGEIVINQGKTNVHFTPGGLQTFSLSLNLSSLQFRDVQTPAGTFTELYVPGYGFTNVPGDPKLPVYHRLMEIPLNAGTEIHILGENYREYDMVQSGMPDLVIPSQPPVSKNVPDPSKLPLIKNDSTYLLNQFLGGPVVSVSPVGIFRSVPLARLDIAPVEYNPVTGRLRIYESLEVEIVFTHPDVQGTKDLMQRTYSPAFENLYDQLPNLYAPDTLITGGPLTYVIVSDPMFRSVLQPFVHWKTKKGFKVIQGYTDDPNVGNTKTSIRNYLMNLYYSPPAGYASPSFVLFVGDVGQIPAWTDNGHPSDLKYCEYTNDNIPEVFYGRFSANNLTQVQPYIDKAMEYEQYTMPDDSFLGNSTLVAGADATNGPLYGNGQINYGKNNYFNPAHNILSHNYLQPEPVGGNYAANIHADVSNGECFSNYTAHGSEAGWADPEFVISDIPALQNIHKYCLMIGNCCKTSNFGTNCFAEEITRAANKGALGYIGCSDYSYWDEDFWWAVGYKTVSTNPQYSPLHLGAYDVTFHDHGEATSNWYVTMGQMVVGGDLSVESSNSSIKRYYWETYCLMGDPSLSVYYSVPSAMMASYPVVLVTGSNTLTVTTEPYAYVALSKSDTILLDARTADNSGIANLAFDSINEIDTLAIVITKQNRKPLYGSIRIIPPNVPFVVFSSYTVNDSIGGNNNHLLDFNESAFLNVSVQNIGSAAAGIVSGVLSTQDTNVVITDSTYTFGDVPKGDIITGLNAFGLTVKPNIQDQHHVMMKLTLTDGTNTWVSDLDLVLNAPALSFGQLTVLDPAPGGNNNGVLDPGESVTLKMEVNNNGHSQVTNAICHAAIAPGSEAYILLNDPYYFLGTLAAGSTGYAYTSALTNGITPAGTTVSLNYNATAGTMNQYPASGQFNLEIGVPTAYIMTSGSVTACSGIFYDPGGPDQNYSNNQDVIEIFYPGTSGAQIQMTFTSFSLEPETNCSFDNLTIYNGPGITSPVIGIYCGTNSPGTVVSTNGALTFKFHSDYSNTFPGWSANIACVGGPLSVIANGFPLTVCKGSSSQLVAIPAGGSGNYTYEWSPADYLDNPVSRTPISTPEAEITYSVTVSDGSSQITSVPVTLSVNPVPDTPEIALQGDTLFSSVEKGNQWYINGAMMPGETGHFLVPVTSGGYYSVIIDSLTGCQSSPSNMINYFITGITPQENNAKVSVYPNPAHDLLNLRYEISGHSPVMVTLYDMQGKAIRTFANIPDQPAGNHSMILRMNEIESGICYLRIITNEYTLVKKILISK